MVPLRFGIPGYITPLVVITAGYALFQAANNTAVMTTSRPEQRGAIAVNNYQLKHTRRSPLLLPPTMFQEH